MNAEKKDVEKHKRRKAKAIDDAVFAATERLVTTKGFNNVTLTGIMKEANVEPKVLYKRFDSLLSLFDKFIRQYDYWLHDLIGFDLEKRPLEQTMKDLLIGLIESLNENPVMQKILVWELSEQNYITTRMSVNRELQSKVILDFFNKHTTNKDVDFNSVAALLIGGIYYQILHKDVSTFCEKDYNNEENKAEFIKTIEYILDALYAPGNIILSEKTKIASSLLENGVDADIISKSTGLTVKEIKKLANIKQNSL